MPYPGRARFRVKQTAYFRRVGTWKAGGVPVDLTGWAGKMQVRDRRGQMVYEFNTTPGVGLGDITLAADGTVTLESADLSAAAVGEYDFDLRLTNPASEKEFLVEGTVEITASVTA